MFTFRVRTFLLECTDEIVAVVEFLSCSLMCAFGGYRVLYNKRLCYNLVAVVGGTRPISTEFLFTPE